MKSINSNIVKVNFRIFLQNGRKVKKKEKMLKESRMQASDFSLLVVCGAAGSTDQLQAKYVAYKTNPL